MTASQSTDHVYRVTYRTEAGRVGGVSLIAASPEEAVAKVRARDSLMATAPRMVATAAS